MESEGSEPDKAAFLAAARLSTSSAASSAYLKNHKLERSEMIKPKLV